MEALASDNACMRYCFQVTLRFDLVAPLGLALNEFMVVDEVDVGGQVATMAKEPEK